MFCKSTILMCFSGPDQIWAYGIILSFSSLWLTNSGSEEMDFHKQTFSLWLQVAIIEVTVICNSSSSEIQIPHHKNIYYLLPIYEALYKQKKNLH